MRFSLQQQYIQKAIRILAPLLFAFWVGLFLIHSDTFEKVNSPPIGEHFWASADRACLARTYQQDGNSFWEPRVYLTNGQREGITAGELPLIPWVASRLYLIGGFHEYFFRGLVLALSLLSFAMAYLLAQTLVKNPLVASIAASLWVLSANLLYYGNSHLSDVPAMGFVTAALWLLLRRNESQKALAWIGFSLLLGMGGLLKLSAILPAFAILAAWLFTTGRQRLKTPKDWAALVVALAVPLAAIFTWVRYARHLTKENGVFVFLLEPLPPKDLPTLLRGIETFVSFGPYYMAPLAWILLGIGTLAGLIFLRRSNKFLLLAAAFTYLSFFAFFLLMFEKAPTHHYYTVPFQLGILFHFLWIADLLTKFRIPAWAGALATLGCMIALNAVAVQQSKVVKARYTHSPVVYSEYLDFEPVLEKLGVSYDDRVLSYDDFTFNVSLYLMNRKGMTLSPQSSPEHMQKAIAGCDYAVLNTQLYVRESGLSQHLGSPLGSHRGLTVYPILKPPVAP